MSTFTNYEEENEISKLGYSINTTTIRSQKILTKHTDTESIFRDEEHSEGGTEVFIGRVPPSFTTIELLKVASLIAKPSVLRCVIENSGKSKGYMFATYETPKEATDTIAYLQDLEAIPGWYLGALPMLNFRRLYIRGINGNTSLFILAKMIYQGGEFTKMFVKEHEGTNSRSVLVQYVTHALAAKARKYFLGMGFRIFNEEVSIGWSISIYDFDFSKYSKVFEMYGTMCLMYPLTTVDYKKLEILQHHEYLMEREATQKRNSKVDYRSFGMRTINFNEEYQVLDDGVILCKLAEHPRQASPTHVKYPYQINKHVPRQIVQDTGMGFYKARATQEDPRHQINQMKNLQATAAYRRPITNNQNCTKVLRPIDNNMVSPYFMVKVRDPNSGFNSRAEETKYSGMIATPESRENVNLYNMNQSNVNPFTMHSNSFFENHIKQIWENKSPMEYLSQSTSSSGSGMGSERNPQSQSTNGSGYSGKGNNISDIKEDKLTDFGFKLDLDF